MPDKGLVHIYTGEGKGKTTSAIGLAVRARSRGKRVLLAHFFKERDSLSEIPLLEQMGINTVVFDTIKSPFFYPTISRDYLRTETIKALELIRHLCSEQLPDLVILDEFICLVSENVLSEQEAMSFITDKPAKIEVVLTGRGATDGIIRLADYVTNMQNIKHPFDRGIPARKGIEV
ncbi:MAG: cob(I)yrinic acid a,c-diamide adenosyltransferase [Nitrospirae bacterium]|nr:cob(I)yrinic acid a,c-diamide adenosyltransferase [Nitrospirota bacterium]